MMHRYLITLLAVFTLLSQWGWVEHAYHEHETGEVCEVCLKGNAYDHAITVGLASPPPTDATVVGQQFQPMLLAQRLLRHYHSRAPPLFL